jgi:o-succinylbenzoate synthase
MQIEIKNYKMNFRFEAGTSRGVLTSKETYFIKLYEPDNPEIFGIGECAPLPGLSPDSGADLPKAFSALNKKILSATDTEVYQIIQNLPPEYPALRFGMETAWRDFKRGGNRLLFDNDFVHGLSAIPINGLVWMGDKRLMLQRLNEKIDEGYNCIKIKIGGIDFDEELELLKYIRKHFTGEEITVRLDANGAFEYEDALKRLEQLAAFDIHSIEQPIRQGNWDAMAEICARSPIPIALDEELINVYEKDIKINLLDTVKPAYIILKPTLLGGFEHCREWIMLGEERNIGWWITSALESNIGLNAIAQFAANYQLNMPQGLGTGQLFHNNIPSPLNIYNGYLRYDKQNSWDLSALI